MAFTIQKHTVRSKWKRNLNDTTINRKKIQKQSLPMLSQTLQKLSTKIKIFIRDFFFFFNKNKWKRKETRISSFLITATHQHHKMENKNQNFINNGNPEQCSTFHHRLKPPKFWKHTVFLTSHQSNKLETQTHHNKARIQRKNLRYTFNKNIILDQKQTTMRKRQSWKKRKPVNSNSRR